MTEEQYKILCECCDFFLEGKEDAVDAMAIPWLHLLNEHPVNLNNYKLVFNDFPLPKFLVAKAVLRLIFSWLTTSNSKKGWVSSTDIPERVDVLYVSHLVSKAHIGINEDFYFGSLPDYCCENGLSSAILLNNHIGRSLSKLNLSWPHSKIPRVVFDKILQIKQEITLVNRLKKQSRILKAKADECTNVIQKRFFEIASRQALSNHSITTLRFYLQAVKLIQVLKPKTVITTYEGHAWERLFFAATRSVDSTIQCIGYHHTILFPRQYALKRNLGERFDPNIVFTAGSVTKDVLKNALVGGVSKIDVESLGTHRVLNHQQNSMIDGPNFNNKVCLVLPDGTIEECILIISFVVKVAKKLPFIKFIIRMHPVISFDYVLRKNKILKNLPENIELSKMTIAEDFARARWAIYRGSSSAIYAVLAGLRPFYVSVDDELSIDPLYQLTNWKINVKNPEEFTEYLLDDIKGDKEDLLKEFDYAYEYCQNYFSSIDHSLFIKKIKESLTMHR